jgi:hypothetical protein
MSRFLPPVARSPRRDAVVNLALALASTLATYAACELIVAKLLLNRIPLDRQEFLSDGLRTLAQSSKQGVVPRPGFVVLEGDSYATGAGDWFLQTDPGTNAAFQSAHVLHELTGKDVISLGWPGSGSLGGFVVSPRRLEACLGRLALFDVPDPGLVLLYFYEGNDLEDNLRDLHSQYEGRYDARKLRDPPYFGRFMDELTAVDANSCGMLDNLVFGSLIGLRPRTQHSRGQLALEKPVPNVDRGDATANVVLIGGSRVAVPLHLQSPAMELSDDELDLACYVLEQSVRASRALFPRARFDIVYVPSPLASYVIASERVDVQRYRASGAREYPRSLLHERSDAIAARVASICSMNGLGFIDARPAIRRATERGLLHGPRDWKHFNRRGYEVLAEAIAEACRSSLLRTVLPAAG